MIWRTAFACLMLLGCDAPREVAPASPPVEEASWAEQIAAVRAGQSDTIRLAERAVTPEQFQELRTDCGGLRTLVLDAKTVSTLDLSALAATPHLRWLKLPGAVMDAGAEQIADCRELEILNLPDSVITNAGVERLATLDRLTLLRFGSPNVTDAGIAALPSLPRLRFLHLIDVPLTDAALPDIAAIRTLESFYLDGGQTTDAGLQNLLKTRPNLHFHKDQQHLPHDPQRDHD